MTKERVENIRKIVLPFIAKKLKEIDYEGLGESDAKEFTNDFNEILNLAEDAIEQDCISRKFKKIVVEYPPADLCIYPEYKGKPYFSIRYEENGEHIIGFGTYNPDVLTRYLQEYFISDIQPKTDVLDKVRAEIEHMIPCSKEALSMKLGVLEIIEKYAEGSEKE